MTKRIAAAATGLLVILLAACGSAGHSPSPSRSAASSGPAALHAAPANPCGLFPLTMAKGLYRNVKAPASASKPTRQAEISTCDYYGPNRSFYVNDVSMEAGTVQAARFEGGSFYKPPRQLAASIVGNPPAADDTGAYAIDLSRPGTQAVFLFEGKQGGGSDQSVTWIRGDLQVVVEARSQGPTGGTKSLRKTLIADALQVNSELP